MAYYNNNNNNYRYKNNGYKNKNKNNNRYYNNYNRPHNDNMIFDASKNKIPDFKIKDLNGKIYTIKGNFDTGFRNELIATVDRIKAISTKTDDITAIPELIDILKEWCLKLINLNPDGIEYTMRDVNAGFDDLTTLVELTYCIFEMIANADNGKDKKLADITANLTNNK